MPGERNASKGHCLETYWFNQMSNPAHFQMVRQIGEKGRDLGSSRPFLLTHIYCWTPQRPECHLEPDPTQDSQWGQDELPSPSEPGPLSPAKGNIHGMSSEKQEIIQPSFLRIHESLGDSHYVGVIRLWRCYCGWLILFGQRQRPEVRT